MKSNLKQFVKLYIIVHKNHLCFKIYNIYFVSIVAFFTFCFENVDENYE